MSNSYFQFKQFRIEQGHCAMKVTTEACIFGAITGCQGITQPAHNILDIGTGTGLLALMKAQQSADFTPAPQIDAIEIDEEAYQQAKMNFANSPWNDRLTVHHLPLEEFSPNKKYDLIICNPPFFAKHMLSNDAAKNKAIHTLKLDYETLASHIKRLLHPEKGIAWVLYPEHPMALFSEKMEARGLSITETFTLLNQPKMPIFRQIKGFTRHHNPHCNDTIYHIRDKEKNYSNAILEKLKPYYLNL